MPLTEGQQILNRDDGDKNKQQSKSISMIFVMVQFSSHNLSHL